jgi:hypothetical protein
MRTHARTNARTHAQTHARTHAHTHTHTRLVRATNDAPHCIPTSWARSPACTTPTRIHPQRVGLHIHAHTEVVASGAGRRCGHFPHAQHLFRSETADAGEHRAAHNAPCRGAAAKTRAQRWALATRAGIRVPRTRSPLPSAKRKVRVMYRSHHCSKPPTAACACSCRATGRQVVRTRTSDHMHGISRDVPTCASATASNSSSSGVIMGAVPARANSWRPHEHQQALFHSSLERLPPGSERVRGLRTGPAGDGATRATRGL